MIATAQTFVVLAVGLVAFGLSLWSLVDAATRPATAFTSAGKRTKTFWLVLTGVATALTFIGCRRAACRSSRSAPRSSPASTSPTSVPAVQPYSRRRGRGGPGGPPSRGGW